MPPRKRPPLIDFQNEIVKMYVSRHKNKFIKNAQMPPTKRIPVIDFQNEIVCVRREGVEEGRESGRGRRFIRWVFDKRLGAIRPHQ